jgi:enoyl-CoA hydratase/carnithine racemase
MSETAQPLVKLDRYEAVAVVTLNRPEQRNALSPELMAELGAAIDGLDRDPAIRCIVIAGNDDVFAAGADIKRMSQRSFQDVMEASTMPFWQQVAACRTPLIAAVSGWALGGGCELALLCDMIVASDTADFGQPEITLGIIPGGGGTQRLARVIGKQRAMELVLTGRRVDAKEALRLGFVNQIATKRTWLPEAITLAEVVARRPPLAAKLAKQAVLAAEETPLSAGLAMERRLYELAMASEDRVEGMSAFLEKRKPDFSGR